MSVIARLSGYSASRCNQMKQSRIQAGSRSSNLEENHNSRNQKHAVELSCFNYALYYY